MAKLNETRLAPLSNVDLVVSVGSVDGILTAAALLRLIGKEKKVVEVCFTQAFTVDRLPVHDWSGRTVAIVDLAVNNRNPQMTRSFVEQLQKHNTLVAVVDEHSREDWLEVLGSFDELCIEPESQNMEEIEGPRYGLCDGYCPEGAHTHQNDPPKSSGMVFLRALEKADVELDAHSRALLEAADAGDRMDFSTHFGAIVNQAVKSNIADDTRRVHLVHHLAFNREPDETIAAWMAEYEAILRNHDVIVAAREDLGDGIHRVRATGMAVDMTTLMSRLYRDGARVVALEGEAYDKALGRKTLQIAFGTADRDLDLLAVVKNAVPSASGFRQKVNVSPEHETTAIAAIHSALR